MSHQILIHDSNRVSNIGNAFFTAGAKYLLSKTCVNSIVISAPSKTNGGWPFRFSYNSKNDLDYIRYSDPDWFVISGPMLDRNFPFTYNDIFERLFKNNKTKIVLLSAGGINYSSDEINLCKNFLKKYPPHILFTRDEKTFQNYSELATHSYNGICNAFFIPDYYPGYDTDALGKYIVAAFDNSKEPTIDLSNVNNIIEDQYEAPDTEFNQINRLQMMLNEKVPERSGLYKIVRPNHNVMRSPINFLLRKPNTFVSQSYEGYLNIYRNTELTLTDRIHACVATLAYGRPSRLYTKSKRSYLLSRLNLDIVKTRIIMPDIDYINKEKAMMMEKLSDIYKLETNCL